MPGDDKPALDPHKLAQMVDDDKGLEENWSDPGPENDDPEAGFVETGGRSFGAPVQGQEDNAEVGRPLDFILDIPLEISVELGRTRMIINDLLQLGQGSVIELAKLAGEPLEILVNGKLVARGEVVVVNEKFGVRVTDIVSPMERVKSLS